MIADSVPAAAPAAGAEAGPLPLAAERPGAEEEGTVTWPDEVAESSFLADARARGEPVAVTPKTAPDDAEERDRTELPSLDDLVQRIPAEVRETLDDLFRARFVTVKRVPKRALKP